MSGLEALRSGHERIAQAARWMPSRIAGIWSWQKKAFWTLGDQALFSGTNFLVNVLLARWLSPTAYGAYSLAYAVFLAIAALHSAILVEPMMIFGAGKYSECFRQYLRRLLQGHVLLTIPASVMLLLAGTLLGRIYSPAVREALFGLAFVAVGILLFWLIRRVFYVLLSPVRSACASGVYFLCMVAFVYLLKATNSLSAKNVFIVIGIASVVASATIMFFLRRLRSRNKDLALSDAASAHWNYGKWALCTAAIQWFPSQVYFGLLPIWMGLESAGALRALLNVAMPVLQAIAALSMLLLPALVRQRRLEQPKFTRMMFGYLGLFLGGTVAYALVLCVSKGAIFDFVYAGRYSAYTGLPLILAALLPFGSSFTAVLGNALRALEQPDMVFRCYAASAVGTLFIGVPLAARLGVVGALIGLHVSTMVTLLTMLWFFRKKISSPESQFLPEVVAP